MGAPVSAASAAPPLRLALLPTEKVLPVLVAEADGLFAAHGVAVEIKFIPAAADRDRAAARHEYDGYLVNLVSLVLGYRGGGDLRATRVLLRSTADHPMFHLVARPGLRRMPAAGDRVAVSRGTIVDYVTFRLLDALGIAPGAVTWIDVPDIQQRGRALLAGDVEFATLPEPAASTTLAAGGTSVADDRRVAVPPPGIAFHAGVLRARGAEVSRLLAAVDEAAALVNRDPSRHLPLLVRHGLVPVERLGDYPVPRFAVADAPGPADVAPILAWLRERDGGGAGAITSADAAALAAELVVAPGPA